MKNIFKIHPLTYIIALIFILIGYFKFYLCFMIVLLIHELGHIIMALVFRWHIKKIVVLPLGLLLKFEDNLNKPLIEEFVISISGIIFQLVFIILIHNNYLVLSSNIILIFNMLPIYPLDGSKVINILINIITNFKTSYFLTLLISFIALILLICLSIINKSLILILSFIPLLINLIDLIINKDNIFIKFLLERYIYNFKFKKYKYINDIKYMKRDYHHYLISGKNIIEEKEYLKEYFN